MNHADFVKMKELFKSADTAGKIEIYVNANGLDSAQYRELLTLFPLNELGKLEAALG
ncbi:MAG: hypothetical protein FWE34_03075 [Defluviitaleaceae bacterium]|nr:hypothetical protein [Defluviitaleaceae bacterium]